MFQSHVIPSFGRCKPPLRIHDLQGVSQPLSVHIGLLGAKMSPCLREQVWTAAKRICFSLDVLCLILFVPFLFYWNLIGFRF